jgi:hypothetical protein
MALPTFALSLFFSNTHFGKTKAHTQETHSSRYTTPQTVTAIVCIQDNGVDSKVLIRISAALLWQEDA